VAKVPELNREDTVFMSGVEQYKYGWKQFISFFKLATDLGIEATGDLFALKKEWGLSMFPIDVHLSMFLNALRSQASEEQLDKWLSKCIGGPIIGTYAQTELGHGTFLRGMETTATFDGVTDEFILHSPTDTAMKWWPGGLGRTANHCLLYARLFIDGQDYGPHAFFVQLRSLEDHKPLPGVELGDIGPKMGWPAIDNGYLKLGRSFLFLFYDLLPWGLTARVQRYADHVRIPRGNMLNKFVKVTREGKYEKPPHAKFNYTTMVMVRTGMVEGSFETLGKSVTICVRYSVVRRQGGSDPGEPEKQILDYKTQQQMVFHHLSVAYAVLFAGKFLRQLFNTFAHRTDDQDFSVLPELHATSAGLKALTTELAAEGAEYLRRYCGGHGFHKFSGLPDLLNDHLPQVTGEGVNPVLYLQTARYLVRQVENVRKGAAIPSTLAYLANYKPNSPGRFSATRPEDLLKPGVLLEAFRHRAARLIFEGAEAVTDLQKKRGLAFEKAIDEVSPDLVTAAKAHGTLFLVNSFIEIISVSFCLFELRYTDGLTFFFSFNFLSSSKHPMSS